MTLKYILVEMLVSSLHSAVFNHFTNNRSNYQITNKDVL